MTNLLPLLLLSLGCAGGDFQLRPADDAQPLSVTAEPWPEADALFRKDPRWCGASAEKVEQLVTKKIEEQIAANASVTKIESISRTGLSVVYVEFDENLEQTGKEFDDIKLKLDSLQGLPDEAGPINFIKDFGDTAALMLTVASPKVSEVEIALRADAVRHAVERVRAQTPTSNAHKRAVLVVCVPQEFNPQAAGRYRDFFAASLTAEGAARDVRPLDGAGFTGLDMVTGLDDASLLAAFHRFVRERLQVSGLRPDAWQPAIVRDPRETQEKPTAVARDKYSYREMDEFSDLIEKSVKAIPVVSKVSRTGLLDEQIFLHYSQERLAAYGIQPSAMPSLG